MMLYSRPTKLTLTALGGALLLSISASGARLPHDLSTLAIDMVTAHNAFRVPLGLPPLKWSEKLASDAQSWADTLARTGEFRHMPNNWEGENLYAIRGGVATPDDVVHEWAAEGLDYRYTVNSCNSMCGHYTQIVWRQTTEVGCAVAHGSREGRSAEVWVCRYNPAGNIIGQRPY